MHVGPPSPVPQRKFLSSDLIASETETDEERSRQTDDHAGHTDAGADVTHTRLVPRGDEGRMADTDGGRDLKHCLELDSGAGDAGRPSR